MKYPSLQSGKFIKRYKRFLVDVELGDGKTLTIHCPNTGAMTGCKEPGMTVYYSTSDNPARKYPNTMEWIKLVNGSAACVNTHMPNLLVKEAIQTGVITELQGYRILETEKKYGQEGSRIDLLLREHATQPSCYVEVKNVTLVERDTGYFPDAVSVRALKHLRELRLMVEAGCRAAVVFCINHTSIRMLKPADKVDHDYGELLREVQQAGVELLAYQTQINEKEIKIVRKIPIDLSV